MEKTKTGLSANIAAAIAYSLPPVAAITGIIMLVLETDNKFVRFHAMQSFILACVFGIATSVASMLPFIGGVIASAIGVVALVSWIIMIVNAIDSKYYKYPFVGEIIYNKIVL